MNIKTSLDRKIHTKFDSIKSEEYYTEWTFHDVIKLNIIYFIR